MTKRTLILIVLALGVVVAGAIEIGSRSSTSYVSARELANAPFVRTAGSQTGGAVVDAGPSGSWFSQVVSQPTVVYDGVVYRMWFEGSRPVLSDESPYLYNGNIGMAISTDGVRWEIANGGKPVLTPGPPGSFDGHAVSHPHVLYRDGLFRMWYGGADGAQADNSVRVERIGLATSTNGIHWNRENSGKPVVDLGEPGTPDSIQATGACVLFVENRYLMWYGAYNGIHKLMFAESTDGVKWRKRTHPIEGFAPFGADVLGPSVWWDGSSFVMFYSKIREAQWKMFSATSEDGMTWIPARGDRPVLDEADFQAFDSAGPGRNHSVHPSQLILAGGRARMWYGGEDGGRSHEVRTGLMEWSLPWHRRAVRVALGK